MNIQMKVKFIALLYSSHVCDFIFSNSDIYNIYTQYIHYDIHYVIIDGIKNNIFNMLIISLTRNINKKWFHGQFVSLSLNLIT